MKSLNDRNIRTQLKARRSTARIIIDHDTRACYNRLGEAYIEIDFFHDGDVKVPVWPEGHVTIQKFKLVEVKPRRQKRAGRHARLRKVRAIRRHERQALRAEIEADIQDTLADQVPNGDTDCVTATDGMTAEDLWWYENDPYQMLDCDGFDRDGDYIDRDDDVGNDFLEWERLLPYAMTDRHGRRITDSVLCPPEWKLQKPVRRGSGGESD